MCMPKYMEQRVMKGKILLALNSHLELIETLIVRTTKGIMHCRGNHCHIRY